MAHRTPIPPVRPRKGAGRTGGRWATLYLLHILADLDLDPAAAGFQAVLSGHTHRPEMRRSPDGVLYLNPGSCGPRRFDLPVTLARMTVTGARLDAEILPVPAPGP